MQTIVRYSFIWRTNVLSEIINVYKSTGENIFKLCEIIHCVEGINNGAGYVAIMHSCFNFIHGV